MHDFVVVGVGPAGARFARQAAAAGFDVLALEGGEIGEPLACSGHVSRDIWDYTGASGTSDDTPREDLRQNEIRGARFHLEEATTDAAAREYGRDLPGAYPFYRDEPISQVIDRIGLDRHLVKQARDAGAEVQTDRTVLGVTENADGVELQVSTPTGTKTVRARMAAGCDGPQSRVRDSVGLPAPAVILGGLIAHVDESAQGDFVDVHLTQPGLLGWRIPRGDAGVEFGLAAHPGADLHQRLDQLCESYGVTPDTTHAGPIPIGPPETVTSDRTFLIGDAAAQTKPFTGGGILYGLQAADHAAATIDPDKPETLTAYETAWREDLGTDIRLGSVIRRCYGLPEPVRRAGLSLFSGEVGVHMDRPSTLLSRSGLRTLIPGQ